MRRIQDLLEDVEPREAVLKFVGGPFDGKQSKQIVRKKLDGSVSIEMKDRSFYVFSGDDTFTFRGYRPAPAVPKVSWKASLFERLLKSFLKWLEK